MALANTNDKNHQAVFKPEYVAPVVLHLSSDMINGKVNDITGGLFEVGCGWHSSTRLRPVSEFKFSSAAEVSPEVLSKCLRCKPRPLEHHENSNNGLVKVNKDVLETIAGLKRVDVEHVEYEYTDRDVLLYSMFFAYTLRCN